MLVDWFGPLKTIKPSKLGGEKLLTLLISFPSNVKVTWNRSFKPTVVLSVDASNDCAFIIAGTIKSKNKIFMKFFPIAVRFTNPYLFLKVYPSAFSIVSEDPFHYCVEPAESFQLPP